MAMSEAGESTIPAVASNPSNGGAAGGGCTLLKRTVSCGFLDLDIKRVYLTASLIGDLATLEVPPAALATKGSPSPSNSSSSSGKSSGSCSKRSAATLRDFRSRCGADREKFLKKWTQRIRPKRSKKAAPMPDTITPTDDSHTHESNTTSNTRHKHRRRFSFRRRTSRHHHQRSGSNSFSAGSTTSTNTSTSSGRSPTPPLPHHVDNALHHTNAATRAALAFAANTGSEAGKCSVLFPDAEFHCKSSCASSDLFTIPEGKLLLTPCPTNGLPGTYKSKLHTSHFESVMIQDWFLKSFRPEWDDRWKPDWVCTSDENFTFDVALDRNDDAHSCCSAHNAASREPSTGSSFCHERDSYSDEEQA